MIVYWAYVDLFFFVRWSWVLEMCHQIKSIIDIITPLLLYFDNHQNIFYASVLFRGEKNKI